MKKETQQFMRPNHTITGISRLPLFGITAFLSSTYSQASFISHGPHHITSLSNLSQGSFLTLSRTALKNKQNRPSNIEDDDFAFSSYMSEEAKVKGEQLARQFYQELEYRRHRSSEFEWNESEEETCFTRRNDQNNGSKNTKKRIIPTSRVFKNKTTSPVTPQRPALSIGSSILFPFPLFSFSQSPPPSPSAASAGLFSGGGGTVYSPGRSIRAQIDILETTPKNQDGNNRMREGWGGWNRINFGLVEQLDTVEQFGKLVVCSLILVLVFYLAVEVLGSTSDLLEVVMKENEISSIFLAGRDGADFASGASSAVAGSLVEVVTRSMEELLILI